MAHESSEVGGLADPVAYDTAAHPYGVDEPIGVDAHAAGRQRTQICLYVDQPRYRDREPGLGGGLPHHRLQWRFAVINRATREGPDTRRARLSRCPYQKRPSVHVGTHAVGGDPPDRLERGGHGESLL